MASSSHSNRSDLCEIISQKRKITAPFQSTVHHCDSHQITIKCCCKEAKRSVFDRLTFVQPLSYYDDFSDAEEELMYASINMASHETGGSRRSKRPSSRARSQEPSGDGVYRHTRSRSRSSSNQGDSSDHNAGGTHTIDSYIASDSDQTSSTVREFSAYATEDEQDTSTSANQEQRISSLEAALKSMSEMMVGMYVVVMAQRPIIPVTTPVVIPPGVQDPATTVVPSQPTHGIQSIPVTAEVIHIPAQGAPSNSGAGGSAYQAVPLAYPVDQAGAPQTSSDPLEALRIM